MTLEQSTAKSTNRSLPLDAIRGVAVLMVVVYHYRELNLFPTLATPFRNFPFYGMFGVDLFYVLSGYFITKAVLSPQDWRPGLFLRARFSRIYPAFLFSLLIFVSVKIYHTQAVDAHLLVNICLHFFMLHNLLPGVGSSINGTFWTLGVEFPYYLFMLAIGSFIRERRSFWIAILSMIFMCLIWRASVYLYLTGDMSRFFASTQLPGTLDAFAVGGVVAKLSQHPTTNKYLRKWRWPLFAIGLTVTSMSLSYAALHAEHYWSYPWTAILWRTILATGFAITIASCSNMQFNKALAFTGLPWLGKTSYSLYIYHLAAGYLTLRYFSDAAWPVQLLVATVSAVTASWLSWRFIEIRFHRTAVANSVYRA